jgi:hypothetical protein
MKKTGSLKSYVAMLLVCLSLLTLVSCYTLNKEICPGDQEQVVGSGVVIEETRNVSNFDAVRMIGSYKLYLSRGPSQAIRLEGEDNILPIIETRVEGDTLEIESIRPYNSYVGITVYVSIEKIRGLEIVGGSKITGEEDLDADDLHLEIIGAGEIDLAVSARSIFTRIVGAGKMFLEGDANQHRVEIEGAGNIEAANLQVSSYDIIINGAGSCRIFVTNVLNVIINGGGIIYYRGSPTVINSTINGVGKLIQY